MKNKIMFKIGMILLMAIIFLPLVSADVTYSYSYQQNYVTQIFGVLLCCVGVFTLIFNAFEEWKKNDTGETK